MPAASWACGIVNHGSYADTSRCLETVVGQSRSPESVFVYDTGEDPAAYQALEKAHPEVRFESGENRGYAGGANRVVATLRAMRPAPPDFILILNPDVELDPGFGAALADAMAQRAEAVLGTGKLLRPDRETIDSAGIAFPRHRRPRDRGSEEPDRGQFDTCEEVDAASGAAIMIRTKAIDALAFEGELFDEEFFAYHEDTDLSWRARRLGFAVLYAPAAVAVHARGWKKAARAEVPVPIRIHSFKNHYLELVKNETGWGFVRNAPWLIAWEGLRLGFTLLRDREMLAAYPATVRALPSAWRKRQLLKARIADR